MTVTIRPATEADFTPLGRMAASLVRLHHALDAQRFIIFEPIEPGYGRWLVRESQNDKAVVLVAEREGERMARPYAMFVP